MQVIKEISAGASLNEIMDKVLVNPNFGKRPTRREVQRQLYNLEEVGLIKKSGTYGKAEFAITKTGIEELEKLTFLKYKQPKIAKWDGRWRLVAFDIPEPLRDARHHIRRLLKELGFKQLQLSLWIHPLPYLEAFHAIQKAYGIEQHLQLLEVVDFQPTGNMMKHFKKLYPALF